jgi:hypothetical protein
VRMEVLEASGRTGEEIETEHRNIVHTKVS